MHQMSDARLKLLVLVVLLLHVVTAEARYPILQGVNLRNATNSSVESLSPWLRRVRKPRAHGCWSRPLICNQGEIIPKLHKRCCKNRCVNVLTDVNNCGLCGLRCRYNWQCCRGLCIDTNVNPFHCGTCGNKCHFLSFCSYGMCGYAQPLPPFPFPPRPPKPPKPPLPPFPFPPRPPKPPKPPLPPFPFPPKPPKPSHKRHRHHHSGKGHRPPPPS